MTETARTVGDLFAVADWRVEGWDPEQAYREVAQGFVEEWIAVPEAFGEFVREEAANMEQEPDEFLREVLASHGETPQNARVRREYAMPPPGVAAAAASATLPDGAEVQPGQTLIVTSVRRGPDGTEIGFVSTRALWQAVLDARGNGDASR